MVKKCHFRKMKIKWLYLIVLSLVWGSSFILMKKALLGLGPIEIGAFRILITALFLLIIGAKRLKEISKTQWKYIFITAFLGTFFPAFFFALAIENIDIGGPTMVRSAAKNFKNVLIITNKNDYYKITIYLS